MNWIISGTPNRRMIRSASDRFIMKTFVGELRILRSLRITKITSRLPAMPIKPMMKNRTERATTASGDAGAWGTVTLSTDNGDADIAAKIEFSLTSLMAVDTVSVESKV